MKSNMNLGMEIGQHKSKYTSRKQVLEDKLNDNSDELYQEILNLEQEVIEIKNKQLHQIITRDNIDTIFSITSTNEIGKVTDFNEIKSSEYFDLLKYLIRNGYIDETYSDYMTYFYENSLSRIDKNFLKSITDKKAKEYTYKLKNPKLVVSRLRLVDFDQEETLNFYLFTYLLQTSHIDYVERLIEQLKDTKNFKFIGAYFDTTSELPAYIKHLNMRWSEVFFTALNEQSLSEKQIRRYSICSIYYSDDDIIELVNKDNCLCDYISNTWDYLAIDNPNIDRLIHCFTLLGVSFIGFNYAEINKDLFYAVYEESLYEINAKNLQLIQREILGITNEDDIFHKNYTLLYSNPDSAITKYVNQNINEYFDVVMQMSNRTIIDDENVAIAVLNNSDLTDEHKHSYISDLRTIIISIKEIADNSLWSLLLDADIIQYSENNIMEYFNVLKLNESVISYINRCNIDLDFSKVNCDDDTKEKLFDSIIKCNSIENLKYEQILAWDVSDELKIKLLEFSNNGISVIGKNYSTAVYLHILNNSLMKSDLMDLFSSFDQWNDSVQRKIFDYAVLNISSITNNPNSVSEKLKNNLFHSDRLNRDIKIELLISMMPDISENYIKELLPLLGLTNYLKIFDPRSRPKFEVNEENERLLTEFKRHHFIEDFSKSTNNSFKLTRIK